MLKGKISNSLENDGFTISFIHSELRKEHREDDTKVGESEAGTGLQDS